MENDDEHSDYSAPSDNQSLTRLHAFELLNSGDANIFSHLHSIMRETENEGGWKYELADQLLEGDWANSLRTQVWESLILRSRSFPTLKLAMFCEKVWSLIEANEGYNNGVPELEYAVHFLEDTRVFLSDRLRLSNAFLNRDLLVSNRVSQFIAGGVLGSFAPVDTATLFSIENSKSLDFALRESASNTISIIFSREDLSINSISVHREKLKEIASTLLHDSNWFVRKSAETAIFFIELFESEDN